MIKEIYKVMKFESLIKFIDVAVPKSLSAPWDTDGIEVCTDYNLEIGRILLTLDITFDVLEYALKHSYNCIISHHAMIYSPLKKLDLTNAASRKAVFLAKHEICALSMHTKLDSVSGGVNDCLLDVIGMPSSKSEIFGTKDEENIGRVFSYLADSANSAKDFAEHVKKSLEAFYKNSFDNKFDGEIPVSVKYKQGDKPVQKVAAVSGGGIDFAEDAMKMGIDTFFTGESSYSKMIAAYEFNPMGSRINIITAGHFETEAVVLPYLKKIIADEFPKAIIDIYAAPFGTIL